MQIASGVASSPPSPLYQNSVLTMLVIFYVFNFLDRRIGAIQKGPIRVDPGLSDTPIGPMCALVLPRSPGTAAGLIR